MRIRSLSAFVVFLALAVAANASFDPPTARGFKASQVHQIGEFDAVNHFNGNLTVTVPLGQTFMAGDRLPYGFVLTYNSNAWDNLYATCRHKAWNTWTWDDVDDTCHTESAPNLQANAGFGWMVSLGELADSATFVEPTGAVHEFFIRGTDSSADQALRANADVLYTRDSSYLRMIRRRALNPQTGVTELTRSVEYPDGRKYDFTCVAGCGDSPLRGTERYELRKISDLFGNSVSIVRDPKPPAGSSALWRWVVRERAEGGLETESYIRFKYKGLAPYEWVISEIEIPAPPGTDGIASPNGRYTFDYGEQVVPRTLSHDARIAETDYQKNNIQGLTLPTLTSLTLPDGAKWQFTYHVPTAAEVFPPAAGNNIDYYRSYVAYLLETVTMPTGGGYRYTWSNFNFPRKSCNVRPRDRRFYPAAGVKTRQTFSTTGNIGQPWRYFGRILNVGQTSPDDCEPASELRTLMVDPMGTATQYFWSIWQDPTHNPPPGTWKRTEYGMPFTRAIPDPLTAATPGTEDDRFLSTRTFKCGVTTFAGTVTQDMKYYPETVCGEARRESFVRFDHTATCPSSGSILCFNVNSRLASERTLYYDFDPAGVRSLDSWSSSTNSDFDGLGHYRTVTTDGNFGRKNFPSGASTTPAGDVKVSFTDYNSGVSYDPATESVTPFPSVTLPWLLTRYSESSIEEKATSDNGAVTYAAPVGPKERTLYHFDGKGFLRRMRKLAGAAVGPHDVIIEYERPDPGTSDRVVVMERRYGGDEQTIDANPATPLADVPLANPDYVLRNTYRYGSLEAVDYMSCDGNALSLRTQLHDIEPRTGAIVSTTDAAGVTTSYRYDRMGRYARISPPDQADINYTYVVAPGSSTATYVQQEGATVFSQGEVRYDGFGRIVAELTTKLSKDGGTERSIAENAYMPNGWLASTTTRAKENTPHHGTTIYESYDPFGRPLLVRHPGGGRTEYSYAGVRRTGERTYGLALDNGGSSAGRGAFFDRQGRMVRVEEDSAGNEVAEVTVYKYDVAHRLRVVDSGQTTRLFNYDGRGFLTSERHPEVGNTAVTYGSYDTRGNAHEKYYGALGSRTAFDLRLVYDSAERLMEVLRPTSAVTGQSLKKFVYFPSSAAVGSRSRLQTSTRYNYTWDPAAPSRTKSYVVTEKMTYDSAGRLATRTLKQGSKSMVTSFDYDRGGVLNFTGYPTMSGTCASCAPIGVARNVRWTTNYGFLTTVADDARQYAALTYYANGALHQIRHGNGTITQHGLDPNDLPRPASIKVVGAAGYDSGPYAYDTLGNVSAIGSDIYRYDNVSRLVRASLGGGFTQKYEYDRHGNIKAFLTTLPGSGEQRTEIGVSSSNNRLSGAGYDLAGNLTSWTDPQRTDQAAGAFLFDYDPFNMLVRQRGPNVGRVFIYNASDERVASLDYKIDPGAIRETWTTRGARNEVLRDFIRRNGTWTWKDYIHSGSGPIATVSTAEGTRYVHGDHLGSTRLVTDQTAASVETMKYFPFGRELVTATQSTRLKFTGHERDDDGKPAQFGDLDYMHARSYQAMIGRFLSVDSGGFDLHRPQSWNRYAYTRNNPLKAIDPDGRETMLLVGMETNNNPIGHVAIAINDTVYSYGTEWVSSTGNKDWGVDLGQYLDPQLGHRQTEIITLDISAEQEQKLKAHLEANNPNAPGAPKYNEIINTCVTVTENALITTGTIPAPQSQNPNVSEFRPPGTTASITPQGVATNVRRAGLDGSTAVVGNPPQPGFFRSMFQKIWGWFPIPSEQRSVGGGIPR